jgi:outer membrane protein assembly factor BamB
MPLSDETRALVRAHLADSYWRQIGRGLADQREASLVEALVCLDGVEPIAQSDQQWLWMAWIRAYVLDRLGREEARDEAIEELGRVAADLVAPAEGAAEGAAEETDAAPLRIAFPDGLSISLDHARKLLRGTAPREVPRPGPQQGPVPEFHVRWAYETGMMSPVCAVVPLGPERTLICDRTGGGHCLDASTGKLLWQRDVVPAAPPPQADPRRPSGNWHQQLQQLQAAQQMLPHMPPAQRAQTAREIQQALQRLLAQLALPATPVGDEAGRFYVPGLAEVSCFAAEDGRLLWRADAGAAGAPPAGTTATPALAHVSVFLYRGHVLTYEPGSGSVTRIDPATGKVVWERQYTADYPALPTWHNAGASLWGDRLLVYGSRTAVIDLESGEVEWSFEPWRVRKFPVSLREEAAQAGASGPPVPVVHGMPFLSVSPPSSYRMPNPYAYAQPAAQQTRYVSYLEPGVYGGSPMFQAPPGGVSLSAPAVVWASQTGQGSPRRGCLLDRWLLLFDQSGFQIVPTDLPLAGKRINVTGQLVGIAGRVVCLLQGSQLYFADVNDGTVKTVGVQEIATGPAPAPIQAAMDGPRVYVTGPGGVLCVNAMAGRRAFRADWPAEVAPAPPAAAANPAAPGRSAYGPPQPVFPPGATPYFPGSTSYSAGAAGVHVPPIARVERGVLYALAAPHRVVALSQRSDDDR